MSSYPITRAGRRLSRLVDRALRGEEFVITRRGHPVIILKPTGGIVKQKGGRVSAADVDWLAARRVGQTVAPEDAGTFLGKLRDEES